MAGDTFSLVWYVLFLPLAGFLIQALVGKRVVTALGPAAGKRVMGALAVLPIAIAFVLGVGLAYNLTLVPHGHAEIRTLFDWIRIASISIPFEARIDPLSVTMVLIVTGVGALIHLYATGYMAEEKDYTRFFTYMNLFIACMLTLVLANNLALMFVGWEGVGLCSYLLIAFWYKDVANAKAGNKAFIVNRIGDWGLTLGIFMLMSVMLANADKLVVRDGRWLSFDVIFASATQILADKPVIAFGIAALLFIGACGKSAQFPLYFWLPDAMAGPTPVSALIHAATMVTAGVFLLNRLHVLFELSPWASALVACIGAFTALFAALVAFGQTDIKKVLAYSTVSQLGFMFIACGAGAYWAGMFHVATHAFFKALLFLGAGAVIHAMMHNQDMRNYGNLRKYLPITFWTMMAAYLAISGIPPLAGFFSKEAILGGALGNGQAIWNGTNLGVLSGWVGLFVAMLTAFYMTRMTALTFFGGEERWRAIPEGHGHEEHGHEAHERAEHVPHHDKHDFYLTSAEVAARESADHEEHHELNAQHEPREVMPSMWAPLVVLALLSIVGGYALEHMWSLKEWLYPNGLSYLKEALVEGEPKGVPLMPLSIAAALLGIFAGVVVYRGGLPGKEGWDLSKWNPFRRWAGNQFGYDAAVMTAGVKGGDKVGNALWVGIDRSVIDGVFVDGLSRLVSQVGRALRVVQTGYVRAYALLMLVGGVGLIGYLAYMLAHLGGRN